MNLCFKVKDAPAYVDFPFQTPTSLTYAVLKAEPKDRMQLLEAHVETWESGDEYQQDILDRCKALMDSPSLELTEI